MKPKRELGLFDAVMMGLGGAIGFEIFVLLDYAYFILAGSGIILALLLGGLINLLIMLSYCELSAAIPEVGGEYTYTKAAYGGLVAFISGCLRWLASVFGAALAALTFAQQLAYFFSIFSPEVQGIVLVEMPLIAIFVVIVLAALDIRGVKGVGVMIVTAFLAIFAIFVISGLWSGLAPPEVLPKPLPEGLAGVFAATAYTFPMFFGMRALVASVPLIKDPEKNVPRGILLSALLMIPLYFSVAYVAVGVASLEKDAHTPLLNFAAEKIMGLAGGFLFAIAGMVANLSALGTSITVQSSIARGMSRDGYLPKIFLSVHRHFGTPYVAVIAGSLFIMFLSATGVVAFLGYAASFGSILVFALVNLSLMKLRKEKPFMKKPFKTPLYPLTPIAGLVMSLVLLTVPIFLGDVNAINALMSSLGLMSLVLATYYLRMTGRYRLQVAMGGASLGMGIFGTLLTYLIGTGLVPFTLPHIYLYVLTFVSVVSIVAGVLNISTRTRKIF
ncbi:MAG: putative fructoselysine transporter [Candidatus Bathyarchaeota archaeon BA2]|nr:MAG: putative fructoselysine transporter [Candidatus Bathyarchaeota archaeon BA2]